MSVVKKQMVSGYWDPITSSIDWCEKNYQHSFYIAEMFNAFSSLSMVIVGLLIITRLRLRLFGALITIVGIGSFLFHSTLYSRFQALDEVPMIWSAIYIINSTISKPKKGKTTFLIASGIVASIFISCTTGNIQFVLFHAFNLLFQTIAFVKLYQKVQFQRRSLRILKVATFFYSLGLVCWILDLHFCESFQSSNLHSWWHLFSSIGTYYFAKIILNRVRFYQ